jgi:hypothetical protein
MTWINFLRVFEGLAADSGRAAPHPRSEIGIQAV